MFDFTDKKKEKYFRKAEKLIVAAGLENIEIDRDRISLVKNESIKVYTKKFTPARVSISELKKLKSIEGFTILNDRYSQTKKGSEKQLYEEGYFTFQLSQSDR